MALGRSLGFGVFCALVTVSLQSAFGWGSYGHQQINAGAIELIKRTNLGICMNQSRAMMVRLAITPDFEWKMLGTPPTDPALLAKKKRNDKYEHPLHYFEADAFIAPEKVSQATVAALPSDPVYADVVDEYRQALMANLKTVQKIDPAKSLNDPSRAANWEVADHGTAPWRILQLYDLGVAELKKGNLERGFFYLGAMGHYVGDMSQPFHASLNFDGQYYDPTAGGIHHTFESAILEEVAKKSGATMDRTTKLWSHFKATQTAVGTAARAQKTAFAVDRSTVLPRTFQLISTGYTSITPLLAAFSYARSGSLGGYPDEDPAAIATRVNPEAAKSSLHSRPPSTPIAAVRTFLALDYQDPTKALPVQTVLDLATERMGHSSAFLAQLWVSAAREAKKANPSLKLTACPKFTFSDATAIEQYPTPKYLAGLP